MAAQTARPRVPIPWPSTARAGALLVLALVGACALGVSSAAAQTAPSPYLDFRTQLRPTPTPKGPGLGSVANGVSKDAKMLVQADELDYDYNNQRVSAIGNVRMYYQGATIEADRVIYDQRAKRLHAEGNARLTDADGKISYGEVIDLSDDYRDGFVDSLRVETPDQTRIAAARAERSEGNFTVFQSGVYTACEPCKDDPRKPPLWQIKAARIIHNQTEKMIYFESAAIEFFGVPLAYFPYFSAPDPTVKRKTGFLLPVVSSSSAYGFALETPYYVALAPDYDVTFSPRITTRQGPLLQGEYRQRVDSGYFTLRASGIDQLDKSYFIHSDGTPTPGFRQWRGAAEATGRFNLSPQWAWGFDGVLVSDASYFQDYKIRSLQAKTPDPAGMGLTEGVSQLFLAGRGDRSYFDMRAIQYTGFSEFDVQGAIPVIHPVIDYSRTLSSPVLGGEFGYSTNFTSLSRTTPEFDPINRFANSLSACATGTADTAKNVNNCVLRGVPGDYNRVSAEAHWRRQIVDPIGQVWTPFASVRGDVASLNVAADAGVPNFITPGSSEVTRGMPTVGLEYRYPFISVQPWGTQTVEPIAQIIVRPNETQIGRLPNEDAQSLVFDDGNLFRVDKFSGWDRVEGGSRANAGAQYTAQFNQGGSVNMLFGQSYQLFGVNSYAVADLTNTGLASGLDKSRSDYVARLGYQPNSIYNVTSRFRFAETDFSVQRLEVEGRASFDRWTLSVLYGSYAAQQEIGFLDRRQGVLTTSTVKLNANWAAIGAIRYDLIANTFDQTRFGLGYIDDCFMLSLNYVTDYTFSGNAQTSHTILLQFALRTVGGGGVGFGAP
ncbi:MAG: LPS-assembly protein LptD [Xanthobacteraceae bacterium]